MILLEQFKYSLDNRYFYSSQRFKVVYFLTNWLVSTNHKRISVMYFYFIIVTSFTGLLLATIIRIELAVSGRSYLSNNSEKYLTIISLHGIVMVFFVVIPALFGAFGNFLLPTQVCVRDVAFPRLNSFMFWVTPSGFILLMHIYFFDRPVNMVFLSKNNYVRSQKSLVYSYDVETNSISLDSINKNITLLDIHNLRGCFFVSKKKNLYRSYITRKYFSIVEDIISYYNSHNPLNVINTNNAYLKIVKQRNYPELLKNLDILGIYYGCSNGYGPILHNMKYSKIKVSSWVSNQLIPGWAFITPYSSRVKFSAVGKVDIALVVVFAAGLGSILSAVNYVITYRCLSANSIKNRREARSFFADSLLVASRMMFAANPALLIAILFLLSDRHMGTSVFDFSGGGDSILFQHLFWFFGHPEVYIIIIPCFGFVNSLLPNYLRKRLSGRLSLQFSMYTIAFMGFAVWGHHLYMVGLANTTRTLYSTMTVMISVPASTKVLHWCVTLVNSAPRADVGLFFLIAFIYFFTLGGLSGMFVAHIGFDVIFHDTFYVIGHFHVMLAGAATSCIFSAFYYYFSSIFGVDYTRFYAYLHFFFYFFGQLFTVIPMFWLGYSGMPRRVMDYPAYFGGWHSIISGGHVLSLIGYCFFISMIVDSLYENKVSRSKTLGVTRGNTRFSWYIYKKIKLSQCGFIIPHISIISRVDIRKLRELETSNIQFVFSKFK